MFPRPTVIILLFLAEHGLASSDVRKNKQLTVVPADLVKTAKLIDLNDNKIPLVSDNDFAGFSSLVKVALGRNLITSISENAFQGSPVRELLLFGNLLQTIPNLINLRQSLLYLYLQDNDIMNLSMATAVDYNGLHTLNLGNNPLMSLPNMTTLQGTLKVLHLGSCKLHSIPDDYFLGFVALQHLDLSRNLFVNLTAFTFQGLQSLKVLDLQANRLLVSTDPATFSGLGQLQKLTMTDCDELKNALFLGDSSKLTHYQVTRGSFECLEHRVMENKSSLIWLDLSANDMHNFSVNSCEVEAASRYQVPLDFPVLTDLTLAGNFLTFAPNVSLMPRLKKLYLHSNKLTIWPQGYLRNNKDLHTLSLSHNQFDVAPVINEGCEHLLNLEITNNRISLLPTDYFKNCHKITLVNFQHNLLTSVSAFNGIGPSLQKLFLLGNHISAIQANDLANLTGLKDLRVQHNRMKFFNSSVLQNKPSLTMLDLSTNQLKSMGNMYNWCMPNVCKNLRLVLDANPIICDEQLCWMDRYQGYIHVTLYGCVLSMISCPEVTEMEVKMTFKSSGVFKKSGPSPIEHQKLSQKMETAKYCSFWCLEKKGCSNFRFTAGDSEWEPGECVVYINNNEVATK